MSALLCLPFCGRADAQDSGLTAFDLNEKAISYLWNNLDSAEQYARFALDVTRRHSDEHAKAIAYHDTVAPWMDKTRYQIDKLELVVDDSLWPLPKYRELLFIR